jgi:predicted RNase H-like nuclease (RuvC/YqgF family)
LAPREKKLLEALLKTYRHLETRIGESKAFVEKLYEESREAQLIRTIPGFGKYLSVLVADEFGHWRRARRTMAWPLSGICDVTRAMSSRSSIRSSLAPSSPCR